MRFESATILRLTDKQAERFSGDVMVMKVIDV